MKRILIAALLVLIMSVGSFAAAVTISGEMKYGLTKTGDADSEWYSDPAFKLKFANDNLELRLTGSGVVSDIKWLDEDGEECCDPDCDDLSHTHVFGVKLDRANLKLPVAGVGTFVFGRAFFGTGDWDAMGTTHDGISWSNTFDKLTLKALWDVKNEEAGARAAVALGKVAVGGNYFQDVECDDCKAYSVDARFDLNENFDFYGEFGHDDRVDEGEEEDIRAIAAEARVCGLDLYAGRDLAGEETEIYAEKTYNNVLFHAGYVKTDEEDGEVEVYAKYTF